MLKDVERYIPSEEKYLEAFHSIYKELTPGHKLKRFILYID